MSDRVAGHAADCALVLYAGIAKPGAQLECDCDAAEGDEGPNEEPVSVVPAPPMSREQRVTLTGPAAVAYSEYLVAAARLKTAQQAAQDAGVAFRKALDELNAAVLP